jgi:hypothetical protein
MSDDITLRFSQIEWPNMALLAIRTERFEKTDDLVLEIIGLYSDVGKRSEIRFHDATYVALTVDFAAKRSVSDAFDGGRCRYESPWKKTLADSNPYDNFASYFHFELGLVPKGGLINILASNFEVRNF